MPQSLPSRCRRWNLGSRASWASTGCPGRLSRTVRSQPAYYGQLVPQILEVLEGVRTLVMILPLSVLSPLTSHHMAPPSLFCLM